jgi:hypothetical protein
MVAFKHPPRPDDAAVTWAPSPVPVWVEWRITGGFSQRMEGLAVGWTSTVVLVRLASSPEDSRPSPCWAKDCEPRERGEVTVEGGHPFEG